MGTLEAGTSFFHPSNANVDRLKASLEANFTFPITIGFGATVMRCTDCDTVENCLKRRRYLLSRFNIGPKPGFLDKLAFLEFCVKIESKDHRPRSKKAKKNEGYAGF